MFWASCHPWSRRNAWLLCLIPCLTAFLLIASPVRGAETNRSAGEGLRAAVVTEDTIRMLGWPAKGVVRVVEFLPGQIPTLASATAVVSRLVVQTSFVARIPRFDGPRDRIYSSFMAFLETPRSPLVPLGTNRFVEEMYGLATDREPVPAAGSKKGLEVTQVAEALELGIHHATLNVNLGSLIAPAAPAGSLSVSVAGVTLNFDAGYVAALDAKVKALSHAGVLVTLVLQNSPTSDPARDRVMLHPRYETNCPHRLSACNTVTPEGTRWFQGCIEFLAARYTHFERIHGRVVNFVIGQRVNAHSSWYNLGPAPMETVVAEYERTVRIAWTAVRRHSTEARVFAAIEGHWTVLPPGSSVEQAAPAKPFLEALNVISKRHGDLDWQVAFHAWPETAADSRPWLDTAATTNADTAVISFKNLDRLPRFLYEGRQLYRGRPRSVMICGQGFAVGSGPEAARAQAAALAYAWEKVERTVGVESLMVRPPEERPANRLFDDVWRAAGTPDWKKVSAFALPIIGLKDWDELFPRAR